MSCPAVDRAVQWLYQTPDEREVRIMGCGSGLIVRLIVRQPGQLTSNTEVHLAQHELDHPGGALLVERAIHEINRALRL